MKEMGNKLKVRAHQLVDVDPTKHFRRPKVLFSKYNSRAEKCIYIKKKVDDENRTVKDEWTSVCLFYLLQFQTQCLSYVGRQWHYSQVPI